MSTAIRYFTKSKKGNTEKLAQAISKATGLSAKDVSADLEDRVDRLYLVNAMYAANIDSKVVEFLSRNKDKIGEIVNFSTSASGKSTYAAVKRAADGLGIPLSEREFHCAASWIFINKGLPSDDDYKRASVFAVSMLK